MDVRLHIGVGVRLEFGVVGRDEWVLHTQDSRNRFRTRKSLMHPIHPTPKSVLIDVRVPTMGKTCYMSEDVALAHTPGTPIPRNAAWLLEAESLHTGAKLKEVFHYLSGNENFLLCGTFFVKHKLRLSGLHRSFWGLFQ